MVEWGVEIRVGGSVGDVDGLRWPGGLGDVVEEVTDLGFEGITAVDVVGGVEVGVDWSGVGV